MDSVTPLKESMERKGWPPKDIQKTVNILKEAPKRKTDWIKFLDSTLYWMIFAVAVLANLIVSIVLVPLLLTMTDLWLYFTISFIAVSFGTMMEIIIHETAWLQKKRYVIAEIFIPAIALINIYIIVQLSNTLAATLQLPGTNQSALLVGCVYVVCFSAPHIIWLAIRTLRRPAKKPSAAAA
jgi:hypothetical protein